MGRPKTGGRVQISLERILHELFGGHVSLGAVTIYGRNAMHWGVNVSTQRWGYVCFRLPLRCFGRWWPLYFYVSPNATPWASTFHRGGGRAERERERADQRRAAFGHNFDTEANRAALARINGYTDEVEA